MNVDFSTAWFPLAIFDKTASRVIRKASSMQLYWNNLAVTSDYPEIKLVVSNDRVGSKIYETLIPDSGSNINDAIFFDFIGKFSFMKIIYDKKSSLSGTLNVVISFI
jgi:hypothetical protein